MTVTFTANYREVLPHNLVEIIDELVQDNFELSDMLEFIDEHGEKDFAEYYKLYVELGEDYGYAAVDTFLTEVGDPADLENFESAYLGEFSSPADFAENYCEEEADRLHYIIPDWEATADYLLSHEVDRHGDYYFRCYF